MSAEVLWLVAAGILAVGEMVTLALFLGMFAVGALAAAGVAFAGGAFVFQVTAFAGTSAVLFVALRPVARRHLASPPALATGIDALVGEKGTVVEQVDGTSGQVKIKGEVWSARASSEGQVLPVGTPVEIRRIDGAIAIVAGAEL